MSRACLARRRASPWRIWLSALLGSAWGALALAAEVEERSDWAECFAAAEARGTIVVEDARTAPPRRLVYAPERAQQAFSPASTFKIPHSLFALDAGLLRDEFEVIPWDRRERPIAAWNRDQDLRSALRESTVWVYERFAEQLGEAREAAYLQRIGYGNRRTDGAAPFWIEGELAISAEQQIAFLRALQREQLPFRGEHQRLLKAALRNAAGPDWSLHAKTGWSGRIGWWVGWVEWPQGPVFFALNIDTPGRLNDLSKRQAIGRCVLRLLQALPPE